MCSSRRPLVGSAIAKCPFANMKIALIFGCFLFALAEANDKCDIIPTGQSCSFIDENKQLIELDDEQDDYKKACKAAEKQGDCCWVEDEQKCYSKNKGSGKVPVSTNPFSDPPDPKDVDKDISDKVSARHLFIDPLCIPPLPFPSGCKFTRQEPYVLYPPTDVPYCVRIPCSLDPYEQSVLDKSHLKCGSTPGCYFDVELHEYREAFGPAVLAGVPVCHLAIRNAVFLREANLVMANTKSGMWNPYFTNCLLNKYDEEIRKGPSGCDLIPLLRVFKFYPKLAGWEGITSYECLLIDGCWSETRGCSYPVNINDLIVKSGQRYSFHKHEVAYGRPKCQHFFMDNPYEILKSYHRCLASGCTVDISISANYYHYFFDIGLQMSVKDMWFYWAAVLTGQIGPFNLDNGIYWEWDRKFQGRNLEVEGAATPAPQTTTTTTEAGNPFWNFGDFTRRKRSVIGGQSSACGFAFRNRGYRPCRPRPVPKIKRGPHCPYKPFFVPRFNPLKGSFAGCCKINYCYISKHEIRKMHSGPAIYYTEWTDWSDCTVPCGRRKGTQTRTRKCISHDKDLCRLQTEETRPCGGKACDEWTPWRSWTPPCPPGRGGCGIQQKRTRDCYPNRKGCVGKGKSEETRFCKCISDPFNPWG